MVTIRLLNELGDEALMGLTIEEAEKIIQEKQSEGQWFVIDKATNTILKKINLTEDQELLMLPQIAGG